MTTLRHDDDLTPSITYSQHGWRKVIIREYTKNSGHLLLGGMVSIVTRGRDTREDGRQHLSLVMRNFIYTEKTIELILNMYTIILFKLILYNLDMIHNGLFVIYIEMC